MKSLRFSILGFIALILVANWISRRVETNAPHASRVTHIDSPEPGAPAKIANQELPPPAAIRPDPVPPPPRSEESRAASRRDLENPLVTSYPPSTPPPRRAANAAENVAADFDKVFLMLRDYRTLTGENPTGTNAEMMKVIMGDNPKGARLGPPEGQSVNAQGELIDSWGTPYFFHQLSKDLMEIRSAGPDRRMWNDDDIVSD